MDSGILEACPYVSKISKKKVTADNISNHKCNLGHITFGAHNTDNDSIIKTLKEMQNKGLINKPYSHKEASNTTSKSPQSTLLQ